MSNAPIIVTGGSGLIGSAFIRHASQTCDIINLDITEGIDITNAGQILHAIESASSAATVIHFAAFADVSGAHRQNGDKEGLCYRLNVIGTRNVAAACARTGKHLLHLSTDFVFDGELEDSYTEQSPTHPIEWYGATKLMAEDEIKASACPFTIARIGFPYTAYPAPKIDLVRFMLGKLQAGEKVRAIRDQVITPTYINDIVEGLFLLSQHPAVGETFHLSGSTSLSPCELAISIANAFSLDPKLIEPYTLAEHLALDPRPRQRCLRVSNAKWSAFAGLHDLHRPLTIEQGLASIRDLLPQIP